MGYAVSTKLSCNTYIREVSFGGSQWLYSIISRVHIIQRFVHIFWNPGLYTLYYFSADVSLLYQGSVKKN